MHTIGEARLARRTDGVLDFGAKLITYSDAPGRRDVSLTLDLEPISSDRGPTIRACFA
ncbi:hypothetical protein [Trinickia sp.]|uniref:hypothetical protein n=1 Tax=Trinickia sp. TaxID=2571163 RepID=UPI003F818C09